MRAKESTSSNPSVIKLLEEATESHVSPYLNNAHTDHECFSLHNYYVFFDKDQRKKEKTMLMKAPQVLMPRWRCQSYIT